MEYTIKHTIFWPLFVWLVARAQGKLMPAIRRTPPGAEAQDQSRALHLYLVAAYFLPLLLAPAWWAAGYALLVRVALFDIALNLSAGDPVLNVGQTAGSDKFLRKLAPAHPERLSAAFKALALVGAGLLLFLHS